MANNSFSDLKGKVCAITGGAGVIGTAIGEALASCGIKTVILDIREDVAIQSAENLKKKFGTDCIGLAANVLDKDSLVEARKKIEAKFGQLDILINGAGGNSPEATTKREEITADSLGNLEETFFGLKLEGFKKVFDLNFLGTVLPSMVFGEAMIRRGKGVILNVSSMSAYASLTKVPAYSAAKASINNFTEWLAVHFAKAGVRVNAIAPGFFLTNQNRFLLTDEKTGALTARGNKIIANTPMGKFGDPQDLQGAVLFLISDISSFVTGICIPIDGGYNAYGGV
jgi:NAD(P)-dependent dehydrogenase (short-subunit alcohol dehydrogenase family)